MKGWLIPAIGLIALAAIIWALIYFNAHWSWYVWIVCIIGYAFAQTMSSDEKKKKSEE